MAQEYLIKKLKGVRALRIRSYTLVTKVKGAMGKKKSDKFDEDVSKVLASLCDIIKAAMVVIDVVESGLPVSREMKSLIRGINSLQNNAMKVESKYSVLVTQQNLDLFRQELRAVFHKVKKKQKIKGRKISASLLAEALKEAYFKYVERSLHGITRKDILIDEDEVLQSWIKEISEAEIGEPDAAAKWAIERFFEESHKEFMRLTKTNLKIDLKPPYTERSLRTIAETMKKKTRDLSIDFQSTNLESACLKLLAYEKKSTQEFLDKRMRLQRARKSALR